MTILLQDPTVFKDASPYGTAIYGLLVLAGVFVIYYLAKQVEKKETLIANKDSEYKQLAEKTMVVLTEVKEKVLDIRDYRATVFNELKELKDHVNGLEQYIKNKDAK